MLYKLKVETRLPRTNINSGDFLEFGAIKGVLSKPSVVCDLNS